jgi:hypothetical protein
MGPYVPIAPLQARFDDLERSAVPRASILERFERSAFRIEARDRYDVEHGRDEFAAFLEGKPLPPRSTESDPWLSLVAAHKDRGAPDRTGSDREATPHRLHPLRVRRLPRQHRRR